MDSMKITDLVAMLLNEGGPPQEITLGMLMGLYDRTHKRYLTSLIMFGFITVCVIAVLIASALEWADTKLSVLALIALIFLLVAVLGLSRRLNRLSRDYLDIIKVYNLLGRYMKFGRQLYPERYQ
jgi:ABC-type nitrate/sulfonate/bicarbonate transport system permease component